MEVLKKSFDRMKKILSKKIIKIGNMDKEYLIIFSILAIVIVVIIAGYFRFKNGDEDKNDLNQKQSVIGKNEEVLESKDDNLEEAESKRGETGIDDVGEENGVNNRKGKKELVEKIIIHIDGSIQNPGVYEIEEGKRIKDIIDMAGGLNNDANIRNMNLAIKLVDGEKIYIPNNEEINSETKGVKNDKDITGISDKNISLEGSSKKININNAMKKELMMIKGVGESTADKIIEYRSKNGRFKHVEDIKQIEGIGEGKFEKLKEYIMI